MTCCPTPYPEMHMDDYYRPYFLCSNCGRPNEDERRRAIARVPTDVHRGLVAVGYEFEVN